MRKIGIMIGSDSDLPQCLRGLNFLAEAEEKGLVEVVAVITNSIHRNTLSVLASISANKDSVDVWIIGAGWANHLTGICDAFLRYSLRDDKTVVIGVAFNGGTPERNKAAILSITQVPKTQVVYDDFFGEKGFLRACKFAVKGHLPTIQLKSSKPVVFRSLKEAVEGAIRKKREEKPSTKRLFLICIYATSHRYKENKRLFCTDASVQIDWCLTSEVKQCC